MEAVALPENMHENTRQTRNSGTNKPMTDSLGKGNILAAFARANVSQDKENDTLMPIFIDEDNQEEATETLKRRRVATPARKTPNARTFTNLKSDTMPRFGSMQAGSNTAIQQILTIVQKLANGQEEMTKEIALLREENQELRETLKQQAKQVVVNMEPSTRNTPIENTWATVARGRNTGHSQTDRNIVIPIPQANVVRDKVVVITLGKATGEVEKIPITILKETLQNELQKEKKTENIKIIGVAKPNKGRLEVTLETKEQAVTARANKKWTQMIGEGAKLKEAAWHPLKVDGVAREAVCTENGNGWEFREEILQIINESNSCEGDKVNALKIHWLSRVSEKTVGSVTIYLETAEMRDKLLEKGVVIFGANAATPKPFVKQVQPLRCFNCNQYGHMQHSCQKKQPVCGNCAEHHQTRNCKGTSADRCAACHGAHKVTDPRCTIYSKEREAQIQQQQRQGGRYTPWL